MNDHQTPHRTDGTTTRRAGLRVTPRLVATVTGAVLAVAFVLSNRDDAPVSFLWWGWTLPLWLALTVATALGLVVGAGIGYRRGRDHGPGRKGRHD